MKKILIVLAVVVVLAVGVSTYTSDFFSRYFLHYVEAVRNTMDSIYVPDRLHNLLVASSGIVTLFGVVRKFDKRKGCRYRFN